MVLVEVVARHAGVVAVEDPVGAVFLPGDAHAVGAVVQHVHVARKAAVEVRDGGRPQRRAHEVERGQVALGQLVLFLDGRPQPVVGREGEGGRLADEVGVALGSDESIRVSAGLLHDDDRVVGAVDDPELGRPERVKLQVPGQVQAVLFGGDDIDGEAVGLVGPAAEDRDAVPDGVIIIVGDRWGAANDAEGEADGR